MTDNNKTNIIVIGCGLAGLAVSLSLAQKGYCVNVVEKRQTFDSNGATFGLAPNGQLALQRICTEALEYLEKIGILLKTGGFMLPWWEVRDVLLKHARANENITIHMGMQLKSIYDDVNDDTVTVRFDNSNVVLHGIAVIGADGVHSCVRKHLGAEPATPTGASTWRGRIHNVQDIATLSHLLTEVKISKLYHFGPTVVALFNFDSKLPGTIAWVVSSKASVVHGTTTPLDLIEKEDTKDANLVREIFRHTDNINDLIYSTQLCIVPLQDGTRWGGKGRVTLIGDAAHALRPASGLGGSLAFEDAVILSEMIMDSTNIRHTLQEFEQRRLPRCKAISDDQTQRSESAYKPNVAIPPWSNEYVEWLNMGPDAPSCPPTNMYQES